MSVIPNKARVPKRWKLELALLDETTGEPEGVADEYQGHTSGVEWPGNQTPYSWRGGDDNTISDIADGDALCNVTVAQDLTEGSLYRTFRGNVGRRARIVYWPEYDGEYAETADITIIRPPLLTNKAGQIIEHTVGMPSTVPVLYVPAP